MNKKNVQAFTLMELLAVLVILAIIALIVFPIIGDVITDSKMKAFKSSVDGLAHAVSLDYQKDYYTGIREYSYADGNLVLDTVKGESKNKNIKVEGIIENGVGTISVDKNGNTSLMVHDDVWCAVKDFEDKKITIEEKTEENCNVECPIYTIMGKTIRTCEIMTNDPNGNLRYVGSTPKNYVWFNKDAEGNPERWRIIGVFGNQAKIISDEYYSTTIELDDDSDGTNRSNWTIASLKSLLNDGDTSYLKLIETSDETSYSYIDLEHVWDIGGTENLESSTRIDFYNLERDEVVFPNTPEDWTGAIGLMYPSDYGYASNGDLTTCDSANMYDWNEENTFTECAQKSWLFDDNYNQWTLSPDIRDMDYEFAVTDSGLIGSAYVNFTFAVRPTLYLKADTKIVGGQGTYNQPFVLGK